LCVGGTEQCTNQNSDFGTNPTINCPATGAVVPCNMATTPRVMAIVSCLLSDNVTYQNIAAIGMEVWKRVVVAGVGHWELGGYVPSALQGTSSQSGLRGAHCIPSFDEYGSGQE